jgi:hypothetical protein
MKGSIGMSITKTMRTTTGHNVWFCLNCVQKLPKVINDIFEENKDQLMVESL